MYTIRRRPEARLSDNSVMQDAKMEMHDLCVSVLHVGASRMRLYHVVDHNIMLLVFFCIGWSRSCILVLRWSYEL
jgi:hypothetical protein